VDAFVDLERARGQVAVEEVDHSLSTLTRVLAGSELLTPATFAAGKLLMEGAVPPSWEKHWEGPEEPVAYCKAVVARMLAVNAMLDRRRDPGGLLSRPARLDSFFHPETFLNALRQQSAREARVAIDSLALVTAWDPDDGIVRGGCVVEGLRLQGAVLNSGRLEEPAPDAPPFQTLPPVRLAWLAPDAPGAEGPRGGMGGDPPLRVPLYLTATREKAIAEVQLPVLDAEEGARWVLAGAACFAEAD
jgi:dynein heavy chain 2